MLFVLDSYFDSSRLDHAFREKSFQSLLYNHILVEDYTNALSSTYVRLREYKHMSLNQN